MIIRVADLKRMVERLERSYRVEENGICHVEIQADNPGAGKMIEVLKFDINAQDETSGLSIEIFSFAENRPPVAVYTEKLKAK